MGVTPQATNDVVDPTLTETTTLEVDEPEPVPAYTPPTSKAPGIPAKAYPGQTVWRPPQQGSSMMSTASRPISYSGQVLPPAATLALTRSQRRPGALWAKHAHWPLCCQTERRYGSPPVILMLTRRDWSYHGRCSSTWPCRKDLSVDFSPGAKWGSVYIRRVAQDIIHGAQQRGAIMDRIREANRSNPLLMDLESAYPEPQEAAPPTSASTGAYRPSFNFRDFLQRPSLGEHFGSGEGPRVGRGPLPCIYDQPAHEMPLAASIGEADHASNCMGMWARRLLGQENCKRRPAQSYLRDCHFDTPSRTHGSDSRTGS